MTLGDRAEEILESLWIEIVEGGHAHCDVAVLAGDAELKELQRAGYVAVSQHKAALTDTGREVAGGCVRRHRLAERLLVDVLQVKNPLVQEASCKFEHLLHEGLDESICTLLGHPRTCPHGKSIPEGPCCRDARMTTGKIIVSLTDLDSGQTGVVSYIRTHNRDALQKLIAIGILPKTKITVLQRSPTMVLQLGRSQFAIDDELASHVHIRGQADLHED